VCNFLTGGFSRRNFLKISAGTALSLAFRNLHLDGMSGWDVTLSSRLGRTIYSRRYYQSPTTASEELGYYITDAEVNIYEATIGEAMEEHNPIWYRTDDGWVHSTYVQPVQDVKNEPVWDIPEKGFLAEVTVPWTQAWSNKDNKLKRAYHFYFGSTHWVNLVSKDDYGYVWYRVLDDLKGGYYYVLAEDLRRVPANELTPITPEIQDKQIVINLDEQQLAAYENGRVVMAARVSTGYFEGDTPRGEFRVERKQPSRHMAADESHGNGFDLPGVPWVSFISWTGVSMHGTYWHNGYGEPRSHGCINLAPQAAKWIYRWTLPNVPADEDYVESDNGTLVKVV
jgi:lipoprotein-anchoring transpeptidase ErfK/SrfK